MLKAQGLSIHRGGRQILADIDLALPAGQVTGILGANGTGKSSLLAVLAGELRAAAGTITLHDQPLSHWSTAELARWRAVLPQSPSLQFDLPVETVIGMGAYPHARGRAVRNLSPQEAMAADEAALQQVLSMADIAHLYTRRYRQLSGGEQQRVQFARVLYQLLLARRGPDEYRVLMLDEPTASLDPRHQLTLLSAVRQLAHEENMAVLVILHDVNLAAGCCDQLLLIGEGRVAASGTPAGVLTPAVLRSVYGVEAMVLPHPAQPERPLVVF